MFDKYIIVQLQNHVIELGRSWCSTAQEKPYISVFATFLIFTHNYSDITIKSYGLIPNPPDSIINRTIKIEYNMINDELIYETDYLLSNEDWIKDEIIKKFEKYYIKNMADLL